MLNKKTILVLSFLAFIFTSAHAHGWKDNWRNSPLTTKNSNEWRKKPYVSKTSDRWRNSALSARQSESKLRWNKVKWQKSSLNWRNHPYVEKPVDSSKWQNRWDKRKWRYSPLNWRYSELRYKNTIKRSEGTLINPQVKEWVPLDREVVKVPISVEKKEYVKPQIETINENGETISEEASQKLGSDENYFIVYTGKSPFKIEKNVKKSIYPARGGLIETFSSSAVNNQK